MASLDVYPDEVRVRLSPFERLMALHGEIDVPRKSIRSVEVVDAPLSRLQGVRAPGTGFPGLIAYGTFRHRHGKDFIAVRRGQQAVRLTLGGHEFAALILGVDDPEQLVAQITPDQRRSAHSGAG